MGPHLVLILLERSQVLSSQFFYFLPSVRNAQSSVLSPQSSFLSQQSLRRSVRSCSQTIPEAIAKFWRAAGPKVKAFGYMVRKLRSIAFQRRI